MRVIPKDKVTFRLNPENRANYEVEDGEVFRVEVDDCYSGQITDTSARRPDVDVSIMGCAIGPINAKGARLGDTLCMEMLVIDLASQGVIVTSVDPGVLGDQITEPGAKITPVHDSFAHFSEDIKLLLTPVIGVIGIAPKEKEIHRAVPEDHGANMNVKLVAVGSRVYFPVGVQGTGLAVGDTHACMGDRKLSGAGIEAVGRMCLKTTIHRDRPIERPAIETTNGLYFLASRPTLEKSIRIAANDTVQFLMRKLRLNLLDAYRLLSATCDVQIYEIVDDNVAVRVHYPKFHTEIQTL